MAHVVVQDVGMEIFRVQNPAKLAKIFLIRKLRGIAETGFIVNASDFSPQKA
jgi:hypothetical protein